MKRKIFKNKWGVNKTTIRYKLGSNSEKTTFKLFNNAGELVKKIELGKSGYGWNEFSLTLSGLAPGVYMGKIEAKFSKGEDHRFCKIAYIR